MAHPRPGFLLLASLLAAPLARADLSVDPKPAWAGYARHGAVTEVAVRLLAARPGRVEVSVRSDRSAATTAVDLVAARVQYAYLPVRIGEDPRLAIEVRAADGPAQRQALELRPLAVGAAVAIATRGVDAAPDVLPPAPGAGTATHGFRVDPASLPRHPQAYEWVDTLVLDEAALAALDDRQREALAGYLASCGRLVLSQGSPATLRTLREEAGCGGSRVASGRVPPGAEVSAEGLAEDRLPARLQREIEALAAGEVDPGRASELAVYFGAYGIVLALAAWLAPRPVWLLATPVATALVGIAVWSQAAPTSQVLSWAEHNTGERAARFVAVLRVAGHGPGRHSVRVPPTFGLPLPTSAGASVAVEQDASQAGTVALALDTQLLSEHAFLVGGTFAANPPLALTLTPAGPEVTNRGLGHSAPAVLAWQGGRHDVPALAPSERWRPSAPGSAWRATAAEQTLRGRSLREGALLLLPYTLGEAGLIARGVPTRGWLVVRPAVEGPPA